MSSICPKHLKCVAWDYWKHQNKSKINICEQSNYKIDNLCQFSLQNEMLKPKFNLAWLRVLHQIDTIWKLHGRNLQRKNWDRPKHPGFKLRDYISSSPIHLQIMSRSLISVSKCQKTDKNVHISDATVTWPFGLLLTPTGGRVLRTHLALWAATDWYPAEKCFAPFGQATETCMRAVNRQPWLPRGWLVETRSTWYFNKDVISYDII